MSQDKLAPLKPFYSDQVVELKASEMEPFYAQDRQLQLHHDAIKKLEKNYAAFCAGVDVKIQELVDTKVKCHHTISAMRQKATACARRIANWERSKSTRLNSSHSSKTRMPSSA